MKTFYDYDRDGNQFSFEVDDDTVKVMNSPFNTDFEYWIIPEDNKGYYMVVTPIYS